MRNSLFLYLFVTLILSAYACRKDNIPDEFTGTASGKLNGVSWKAQVRAKGNVAAYGDDIGLAIKTFDRNGYQKTSLNFQKVPLGLSTYIIAGANWYYNEGEIGASYSTFEPGGDVFSDFYHLDTLATTNYFEVIRYDSTTHDIEVHFDARYYIAPGFVKEDPNAPDTIRFTEGRVLAKVNFD